MHFHIPFLSKSFETDMADELGYLIALISNVTRQIVPVFVDFPTLSALVYSSRKH